MFVSVCIDCHKGAQRNQPRDSLELSFLSNVQITLHNSNAKLREGSNKTLISHLAEWTKSPARWRHGRYEQGTLLRADILHSDSVTIRGN